MADVSDLVAYTHGDQNDDISRVAGYVGHNTHKSKQGYF
jgi:hypothetical protein